MSVCLWVCSYLLEFFSAKKGKKKEREWDRLPVSIWVCSWPQDYTCLCGCVCSGLSLPCKRAEMSLETSQQFMFWGNPHTQYWLETCCPCFLFWLFNQDSDDWKLPITAACEHFYHYPFWIYGVVGAEMPDKYRKCTEIQVVHQKCPESLITQIAFRSGDYVQLLSQ